MYFISRFVPILQHSPPFTGTYIFLSIFHSNILSMFISSMFVDQAYNRLWQYGIIRLLHSFNLVFQDTSLDLKSFIRAKYAQFAVIILE